MRIDKAEKLVEDILEKYPRTRASDQVLYRAYHYELEKTWQKKVDFATFFTYPEKFGGYNFATIERCRRKIQKYRPELRDEKVAEWRLAKQEEFKDYAKE